MIQRRTQFRPKRQLAELGEDRRTLCVSHVSPSRSLLRCNPAQTILSNLRASTCRIRTACSRPIGTDELPCVPCRQRQARPRSSAECESRSFRRIRNQPARATHCADAATHSHIGLFALFLVARLCLRLCELDRVAINCGCKVDQRKPSVRSLSVVIGLPPMLTFTARRPRVRLVRDPAALAWVC